MDRLLDGSATAHCPIFKAAYKKALNRGLIYGSILKSKLMPGGLAKLTGLNTSHIAKLTPKKLVKLCTSIRDLRVCQRAHNVTVDPTSAAYDDLLENVTKQLVEQRWDRSGLGYLGGGRLLRAIAKRMEAMVELRRNRSHEVDRLYLECNAKGNDNDEIGDCPRNFVLYTGHDTTIFDLRSALGVTALLPGISPYLSHLIFELRENGDGRYHIQVLSGWYDRPAVPQKGPFCEGRSFCSLDKFLRYVEHTIPDDVDLACQVTTDKEGLPLRALFIISLVLLISITGFISCTQLMGLPPKGYSSID